MRQAIALAIDQGAVTRDVLAGQTQPAVNYWDNTPYTAPELGPWPYDPAARTSYWTKPAGSTPMVMAPGTREGSSWRSLMPPLRVRTVWKRRRVFTEQLAQVGIGVEPRLRT